ncbi:BatA domain-containing protein [Schlesneria sp.]|uniref:BatA domain-containing protein n=1 Tax=Schlesneria sp. TaxID=2762018 RepID=UPI002F17F6A7
MTWLYSLYWLGALAAAGPVIFHMWRRMPRGERPFSTLMFLSPSPPRITSRSRIENWLLMLLRVAALALLAFAFTRPLWRVPISEPEQGSQEQQLAILVDTSASMRREGVWNDLIRQIEERLNTVPPQTRVALYRFDRNMVPVADFAELKSLEPAAAREMILSRLRELRPTWEATRLGEALVEVASRLQEVQTEFSRPITQKICLASDLQSGAETVSLQGYEWPDDLSLELIIARPTSPSNAGLQVVEPNQEGADDVLRVRVTNANDSQKEQFVIRWDTPQSPELPVYVPPGQSRIIVPPKLPAGIAATSVVLSGDDDDFDNRVVFANRTPETRLVLYCGSEKPDDTTGARFYLDRLFSASKQIQIELREPDSANLASADSQPALVVLTDPDPQTKGLINRHLSQGGTVLIVSPTPEGMLGCLALCGRDDLLVSEANVSKYAMLGEIDFENPLFAPFAEAQFSDFTGIRFWKHRQLRGLKEAAPKSGDDRPRDTANRDRVLARFDDGDPAIVEFPAQQGKVIVFAAGWQPADSQFARSSKFPMLMFRLLEHSSGITARSGNQIVGSALAWPSTSRAESATGGRVQLPDGTEIDSLPMEEPFSQAPTPGLYTLIVPGRAEQVAVNLAPEESRTSPLNVEQLEGFGLALSGRSPSEDPAARRQREQQLQLVELENSQKLWQRVLLAVIVLLLIETLASGWSRSRAVQAGVHPSPTT